MRDEEVDDSPLIRGPREDIVGEFICWSGRGRYSSSSASASSSEYEKASFLAFLAGR